MHALLLLGAVVASSPGEPFLRKAIAETAVAQVRANDPAWHPDQRDCAGLVRFAYRTAYRRLAPERLKTPLWRDATGRGLDFADAETLLASNFASLGRDEQTRSRLRSGDLVAFRNLGAQGQPVFHLMLVVTTDDPAQARTRVVYHPGEKGAAVRTGELEALLREAPLEWRPTPENSAFLGFFRFKEWMK